jgi:hypothetical protein
MKIAFDIRKLNDFGIGTYIRNLILNLAQLDRESDYFLIGREHDRAEFSTLPANFFFIADPSQESIYWNDFVLPYSLKKKGIELLHTPHYRAPRFLSCKSVITIHDCVHILFPNYASTKSAYNQARQATKRAIKKCSHILTVSEATRR